MPFLQAGLVNDNGWLTQQQFVDAVAIGLTAATRTMRGCRGFVKGATAAAAGAIARAAVEIATDVIDRSASVTIGLIALAALLLPRIEVPEPALVGGAAVVGLVAFG